MKRVLKLAALLGIVIAILLFTGQNAGNTGTATISQRVTYTAGTSQTFRNVGQSAHYLSYCPSGGNFSGTIDLEESFDGTTNWTPITFATYVATPLTQCTVLQAGGYFQNIRSVITIVANSVTAEYNATSGPISFSSSAIGSNGAASPTACNQSKTLTVTQATTALLVGSVPSSQLRVCAYQISGQPGTTGTLAFQTSAAGAGCTAPTDVWGFLTNAGTPDTYALGSGLGQLFATPTANSLCFRNTSTSDVTVSIAFSSVFQGF